MKRLLIVMATMLLVSSCTAGAGSTQALAQTTQLNSVKQQHTALAGESSLLSFPDGNTTNDLTILEQEQRAAQIAKHNKAEIKATVKQLRKTVGKTWYVFSGDTPSGWDCSGLVVWFYEQMGVTLEHSATKQLHSGKHVKKPVAGDIVAFSYPGSSGSFHVGIYVGNGKVIHAYYYGRRTVIQPVAQVQKENGNAKVTYIRILPSSYKLGAAQ